MKQTIKSIKSENDKLNKGDIINLLLSLSAVAIAFVAFNYVKMFESFQLHLEHPKIQEQTQGFFDFKPPIELLFLPVIFLLTLILLELKDK